MQYTFILQHQSSLEAPYGGRLSLDSHGDTQPTHTIGLYSGWSLLAPETGTTVRLLGFRNIARMGIYDEALAFAAARVPPGAGARGTVSQQAHFGASLRAVDRR